MSASVLSYGGWLIPAPHSTLSSKHSQSTALWIEAARWLAKLARDSPDHMMTISGSVLKHALLGEKEQMLNAITERVERYAWWDDLYAYMMAQSYALIGELDCSAHWLNHSIDCGFCNRHFLEHEPHIENLRKG